MTVTMSSKLNKLIMKLIIAAARNDKEKVFSIAQELVKLFEEGLEESEVEKSDKGKG
ncbi:MAG: hypothetical protein QW579_04710 [Desulfurococcaceae archaeon]